jgi:uncharacterized protein (TIGR02246 family)
MKHYIIPAIMLVMLSSCNEKKQNTNQYQTKEIEIMEKKDKQQIEQLLSEYKKSLNTSDAKLSASLYTKDGIFMPREAPSAIGSDNILKSYEYIFSQIQLNIEFFIEEIVVEENLAFATTSSKGSTLIHASGDTVPEENRELFVFEKIEDEWKIARYMFNKTSPKK